MVWLDAPGWSRARLVTTTALDEPVALTIDDAGGIYLALARAAGTARRPSIMALDRAATPRWEYEFAAASAPPRQMSIFATADGLAAFWIAGDQLILARLDRDGALQQAPVALGGQTVVASYSVALDAAGNGTIWFGGAPGRAGVFAGSITNPSAPAQLIDKDGIQPRIQYDAAGTLHAIWQRSTPDAAHEIWYAVIPPGETSLAQPRRIAAIVTPESGVELEGPQLGLDGQYGYILWSTRITSGRNAGAVFSQYHPFALTEANPMVEAQTLAFPRDTRLRYGEAPNGALRGGPRVMLADWSPLSGVAATALTPVGASGELAVIGEAPISAGTTQRTTQVGALFFADGAPQSYQLLTSGRRGSYSPAITADQAGNLYATWREVGLGESPVFFAGTAPDLRAALSVLSTDDIARIAADVLFGMLAGVVIAPISLLFWILPALAVLAPLWFFKPTEGRWMRLVAFGIALAAIGVYWAGKLALFDQAREYVPFSAWIPQLAPWLALPLQLGVPLAIAALALAIAWRVAYRGARQSLFLTAVVYMAVDGLCTMAIYGERLFTQ